MSSLEPPRRATLDPVGAAIEEAFRAERAAVLATLIRHVGDFQLAEDAVQDAFADAVGAWRRGGVPARPGAWLTVAARRRRSIGCAATGRWRIEQVGWRS